MCSTPLRLAVGWDRLGGESRERLAGLFRVCYWYFTGLGLLIVIGNLLGDTVSFAATRNGTFALLAGLGCLALARIGRLALAAGLLLGLYFFAATLGIALLGTVRAPALGVYALLVAAAGLMFGARAMVLAIGASSVAVAALVSLESTGRLPTPDYRVGVTQWVTATALFGCLGGLILMALGHLRRALERAEQALAERAAAETALRQANTELQAALASVKTLKGLLPVCSWCHKVREDEGYWREIESYVAAHSDATFTHGICPECRDLHFPGPKRCEKATEPKASPSR